LVDLLCCNHFVPSWVSVGTIRLRLCCSYVSSTCRRSRLFSSGRRALRVYSLLQLLSSLVEVSCRSLQGVWAFHSYNIRESLLIGVEAYRACSCAVLASLVVAAHSASQSRRGSWGHLFWGYNVFLTPLVYSAPYAPSVVPIVDCRC